MLKYKNTKNLPKIFLSQKWQNLKIFKKGKKRQNIWKYGQKCTKFENILKKGRWLHVIIASYKVLEKSREEKVLILGVIFW